MEKLERLMQKEDGEIYALDGERIIGLGLIGTITTIKVKNPVLDVSSVIDKLTKEGAHFIPHGANAYIVSSFNPDTQFMQDGKAYSCYALQFYHIVK